MSYLSVLKTIATPGSIPFFVTALVAIAGLSAIGPKGNRWGTAAVLALCGLYLVLALPLVANALAGPRNPPISVLPPVKTVVVFDGDNRVGRAREAERLYRGVAPSRIWILGDEWLAGRLVADGIPEAQIRVDDRTPNTYAQVATLRGLAHQPDSGRLAVVASRLQMRRVAALVQAAGLTGAILCPSAIDTEPPATGLQRLLPTYVALRVSRDVLYEDAAMAYYRWRGWIDHE